ncbi:hypothetical protein MRX96_007505 [Rhipicephalus microplus]
MKLSLLEREKLMDCLERMMRMRERALQAGKDVRDLNAQIERMRVSLNYLNENIQHCQDNIFQVQETKVAKTAWNWMPFMVDTQGRYLLDKVLHGDKSDSADCTEQKPGPGGGSQAGTGGGYRNVMLQNLLQHTMNQMQLQPFARPANRRSWKACPAECHHHRPMC